jgi:hypothetical protein
MGFVHFDFYKDGVNKINENNIDGDVFVTFDDYKNSKASSKDLLQLKPINGLSLKGDFFDSAIVNTLKVKFLSIDSEINYSIFDSGVILNSLISLSFDRSSNPSVIANVAPNVRRISFDYCTFKSLENFKVNLIESILFRQCLINTLSGMESFPSLMKMTILGNKRSLSLKEISIVSNTLEHFEVDSVKGGLTDYEELSKLENIKLIRLCSVGRISDLSFVKGLKKLESFSVSAKSIVENFDVKDIEHIPNVYIVEPYYEKKEGVVLKDHTNKTKKQAKDRPEKKAKKLDDFTLTDFWSILEKSLKYSNDLEKQYSFLIKQVSKLSKDKILQFHHHFISLKEKADTELVRAAGYLLHEESLTDDELFGYLGWLVTRGKKVYEAVLKNPDSLAKLNIEELAEVQETELFEGIASEAFEEKYEDDFYELYEEMYGEESMTLNEEEGWDETDLEVIKEKLPKLFAIVFEED